MSKSPYDVYVLYLALKNHFTNLDYDFFTYNGKVKASKESFNKRKDRYFFEKLSRKKQEKEITDFFVSNFVDITDPNKLWVGELKQSGEDRYFSWKKRIQSLSYIVSQDLKKLTEDSHLYEMIISKTSNHPKIIKYYLSGKICLETLIILDDLTDFINKQDLIIGIDPVLDSVLIKVKKYKPFLDYDKTSYVQLVKNQFL